VFFWTLITIALAGPPSLRVLNAAWDKNKVGAASKSIQSIILEPGDLEAVSKGKIGRRRIAEVGPDRVMGIAWTPTSKEGVWVAIIDDVHGKMVSSLSEKRLGRNELGQKLLYQHLSLPWPVTNRHWVIKIWNNIPLADATNNRVWERPWDLADPALMDQADPTAVWIPMTNGAWFLMDAAGGTLVIYTARSNIGGAIPYELVTRWALATVDEMLNHVLERAGEIHHHYGPGHEPIIGGNNEPIPFYGDAKVPDGQKK
jgi:hypothetical protein